MRGGAELGRGGQGRIKTIDELPDHVRGQDSVDLVYVDLKTGADRRAKVETRLLAGMVPGAVFKLALEEEGGRRTTQRHRVDSLMLFRGGRSGRDSRDGSTRDREPVPPAAAPPPSQRPQRTSDTATSISLFRRPPTRPPSRPDPMREEFEDNLKLARVLAAGFVGRRKHLRVLTQNTPFIVREDRFLVVGVVASGGKAHFPMYRRMGGTLSDFQRRFPEESRARVAIEATRACLDMLGVLLAVGVHHCDVKEDNMLFDVLCRRANKDDGGAKGYPPRCDATFALSDYGLVRFSPVTVSSRGTPGSICPLAYTDDERGRAEFEADHLDTTTRVATSAELWDSYKGRRRAAEGLPAARVHEKADLFAVGVMLTRLARPDRDEDGEKKDGEAGGNPAIRRLAAKLIRGDAGSIWTVRSAARAAGKLRA